MDPAWASHQSNDPALAKLTQNPVAVWITGWSDTWTQVRNAVNSAEAQGRTALLVAYNIPSRDCGGYSGGGAANAGAYQAWTGAMADAIGNGPAVVILEPDALTQLDCMSPTNRSERLGLLNGAVDLFTQLPRTNVYLDAGHPGWKSTSYMADALSSAGVDRARGFALNVSNFYGNYENNVYGEDVSSRLGGKHFVVDTSRNGNGSAGGQWCNPWGRALGTNPTSDTGSPHNDAYLWVKRPGESDGNCNGGPGAGQWFASYAYSLING